jgi:two-component system, chemotaxis family, CheB/CheR fusion protein
MAGKKRGHPPKAAAVVQAIKKKTRVKQRSVMEQPQPAKVASVAERREEPFAIVGIGASAGGIEAFTSLLNAMPSNTGLAFVLIQHLAPTRVSLLSEILGRATAMPVTEVNDEPQVAPNHVYVVPPGRNMLVVNGKLSLTPLERGGRPIDNFLTSLAEDKKHRAIAVILSGTATDGTLGLEAIKGAGGITFAQDDTAQHDGMPRSAINAGCVDYVLSPAQIAHELTRIARHPYVAEEWASESDHKELDQVLSLLRHGSGVDFRQYKSSTLHRRIKRRMVLRKMSCLDEYAQYLKSDPQEVEALYQDILISVTSFFRNPEAFESLKARPLATIFRGRSRQDPVRAWVLGCSTGEESYSLAITLAEYAAEIRSSVPIVVYATDLNNAGIEKSRAGIYPKSIAHDVSPERLRRYFVEVDGGYRVSKAIRDLCIFARQNVLADPPFSRMDLISCRNVMIYMEAGLQRKLLPILHYALKPTGYLFLGPSETIGASRDLFEVEDSKHKIYSKKPVTLRIEQSFPLGPYAPEPAERRTDHWREAPKDVQAEMQREADRVLLARYVPTGVLVNGDLEVLQFRGETGLYLAPAPGKASLNLLKMAREGLLVALRALLQRAKKEDIAIYEDGVRVRSNGGFHEIRLSVIPVRQSNSKERCYWVLFEEPGNAAVLPVTAASKGGKRKVAAPAQHSREQQTTLEEKDRLILRLTQELAATREYLQSVIEQQEAANEELQSANEEVQSANEELQSINEELETSKEEIQSSNEELTTVNEELHNRNDELNRANNDLNNLFSSVQMAIVMVWQDLRIRRFTPMAEKLFNLIATDIGRPIGDIKLNLSVGDLPQLLVEVIDSVTTRELEVQDRQGRWYLLRIRPYKTLDNVIDGAVIVLVDIDSLKQSQETLARQVTELDAADRHKNEFLAMLAHELRNPLAPLRNATEILKANVGEESTAKAREMINRQVTNMSRLVDDLLDAGRITRGQVELRMELLDLQAVVGGAVEAVRPAIDQHRHKLSVTLPIWPLNVLGDPTRLEQVFTNLLNNAVKYTPDGGQITVTGELRTALDETGQEAVISVRDNGVGLAPDMLARVFDLFVQADNSLARTQGGLGIGLSLVRSLVAQHGGTVVARSQGIGLGSEFIVTLPVSRDHEGRSAASVSLEQAAIKSY